MSTTPPPSSPRVRPLSVNHVSGVNRQAVCDGHASILQSSGAGHPSISENVPLRAGLDQMFWLVLRH